MVTPMVFQFAGGPFETILNNMQSMGIFTYFFPFLLMLAITYGVLMAVLKDKLGKQPIAVISIVLAFFVMLYSGVNTIIVSFFAGLSGAGLIVGSAILMLVIMFGLVGLKFDDLIGEKGDKRFKWLTVGVLILIIFVVAVGAGAGSLLPLPYWAMGGEFLPMVIFAIIMILAVWFLGSGGDSKPAAAPTK